jgi:hypothetical protein
MHKALIILATVASVSFIVSGADARGGGRGGYGSRVQYGGGHHTTSHGGHYLGGSGSSHRGGIYMNTRTGNQYGTHR